MLQPTNRRTGLRPSKVVTYGAGALVAVFVASLALHAIFGLVSFVIEVAIGIGLVALVLRFLGFRRHR